jgi:hypothetical protein
LALAARTELGQGESIAVALVVVEYLGPGEHALHGTGGGESLGGRCTVAWGQVCVMCCSVARFQARLLHAAAC